MSLWSPPPELKISDWADVNRQLSQEASAEPGRWNTSRAPYQREMMNAICDTERVIMMTAAQVGKTEIILNTIGYYVDQEPAPILILNPTVEMSEAFSKDRLAPMIRDTPALSCKIADAKTRSSGNTLTHKNFPGGHITLSGANSAASLASRPIRVLLCDEVDRYPASAGTEGDPLSLAMKRTLNFWNRKIIWVSTPTLKGVSRIEKAFEISTREEYCGHCPRCGGLAAYDWGSIEYKNVREPVLKCPHCGGKFGRYEWQKSGAWVAENPGAKVRGFHVSSFASPWATWEYLCEQYEEAKAAGEESLKVWHNTVLGLPYEYQNLTLEISDLDDRREDYGAQIPEGVQCLTAGIDTQDNRLEIEIVGWGRNKESWGIEYAIIYGDPGGSDLWSDLDEFLLRTWKFADGRELGISCACIDSAGHYTDEVYKFVKERQARRIFPIVGRGTFGAPSVSRPSFRNRARVALFTVGVSTLKGLLYSRLQLKQPGRGGYCHFPKSYEANYFDGLMSEEMKIKRVAGQDRAVWEKKRGHIRNEPLDCRIYAMAALAIYNPDLSGKKSAPKVGAKKREIILRRGLVL